MPTEMLAVFETAPLWSIAPAFVLGAVVGSFLNVCIARLPAGESVVSPASRCPRCNTAIAPYDNIPMISFVLLRGRCRNCSAKIAWRYPLVELLTATLFAAVVAVQGLSPATFAALALVAALIAVTFIDLDHQIIPNRITLPGIVAGLAVAAVAAGLTITDISLVSVLAVLIALAFGDIEEPDLIHRLALPALLAVLALTAAISAPPMRDSALGVLLGGGTLWAVAAGYEWLRGHEGMGGGDIKLLAMIGAFLGWRAVLVTVMVGSLTGAVIGSIHVWRRRAGDTQVPIPFGPFLAIGAFVALLYGDQVIRWYLDVVLG